MQRLEPSHPVDSRTGAPPALTAPRLRPAAAALLTGAALTCFAANSLLARAALRGGRADPASFTAIRIASGAAFLAVLAAATRRRRAGGSLASAAALVAYAGAFSLSYVRIPTGAGALLLFAAVQVTMIGVSVARGARPTRRQWLGVALALGGLAALTRPGAQAIDGGGAALMLLAGAAWGVYTLRGRTARDPLATTAHNFVLATALVLPFAAAALASAGARLGAAGLALAVASGALASGGGYTLWYAVVPALGATRAAALQLAVPVIAALGGIALLGERVTLRFLVSATAILAGIALTLFRPGR